MLLRMLWPVMISSTKMRKMATIARRPFQISALLVQPHSHIATGEGTARRSRSYASSSASSSPASVKETRGDRLGQTKVTMSYQQVT